MEELFGITHLTEEKLAEILEEYRKASREVEFNLSVKSDTPVSVGDKFPIGRYDDKNRNERVDFETICGVVKRIEFQTDSISVEAYKKLICGFEEITEDNEDWIKMLGF